MTEANIYIFGEITEFQEEDIEAWGAVNLKSITKAWEAQKTAEKVVLHINSPGGDVDEGFAIHDYIRSLGVTVETRVTGFCGSISTIVALAGDKDKRFMSSNSTYFIHNPWGGTGGDRKQIQEYADYLERAEQKIANFYAAKTGISPETALALMTGDTEFTAAQAKENGFISEIVATMKAVAKFNPNNIEMTKTKTEQETLAAAILKGLKNLVGTKAKNKIVTAGDGETEIDFADLEDDATPAVDDTATIGGDPADGEYVMPSGETYVFAAGVLTEIKPKEDDTADSEDVVALKAENEQLKADLETANAKALKQTTRAEGLETAQKASAKAILKIQSQMEEYEELAGADYKTPANRSKDKKNKNGSREVFKS